jgi:predicted amidohydrolase
MKVAALQMQPAGSVAKNLRSIEAAARSAAAYGATVLVTPEMGVTGYAIWDDVQRLAQARDGAIVTAICAIARAQNLAIVAGFPEREGEVVYNCVVLAQADGRVTFYRKCHLYGALESAAYRASDCLAPLVSLGGLKTGLLICYDVEFPEMVRSLVLAGAEMILVATALPRGQAASRVSNVMIATRALENHVFIVYADLCGVENDTPYEGGSVIAGPDGEILARAGYAEALLITDVDVSAYDRVNLDPYLVDRRPAIYQH